MKQNLTIAFLTLFILANTVSVRAVETDTSISVSPTMKAETTREKVKTEMEETRKNLIDELKTTGTQVRKELETKKVETKAEMEAKREEFKQKMAEMKDTRKKAVVERVDEKINNLNEKHTVRLSQFVENVMQVLTNLQKRADALKAKGVDTKDIDQSITEAKTSLEAAQTAIDAQAAKVYTLEITDETSVKTVAKELVTQFKEDLKTLHTIVKEAHQKVVEISRSLAKLQKATKPSGTPTGEAENEPSKSPTAEPTEVTPSVSPTTEPAL